MAYIMIDVRAVLRKLKRAIDPAIESGILSPNDAQAMITHVFHDPIVLNVFQYVHEKPERDYFVGFDCLTSSDLDVFTQELIDTDGENPIDWTISIGTLKLHCLNRYVSNEQTLTQAPNGTFVFTEREGTVDTYLIIEASVDHQ